MRRYGAKRDLSEPAIKAALEARNWQVVQVSGPSLPDLWIYKPERGGHWVEVKTGTAKLRTTQQWTFPVLVFRSEQDAIAFDSRG